MKVSDIGELGGQGLDDAVRLAAFEFLNQQKTLHGDVLPRKALETGFLFKGARVPLIGPAGIFKPALLPDMPISITTVPVIEGRPRPYDDEVGKDGLLRYRYRGTNPLHPDNAGLKRAMNRQAPLIYLFGVLPGRYIAEFPVYIVGDDPANLTFSVAMDDAQGLVLGHSFTGGLADDAVALRRKYITTTARQRLHQQAFRERVLRAYQDQCSICRLRHQELLEAAHILPDRHPKGDPIIPNGIALCKLHHAAFDRHILGIRPDYVVEIRMDILQEIDGPMLKHGLQGFQGAHLHIPKSRDARPNQEFLAERYSLFQKA